MGDGYGGVDHGSAGCGGYGRLGGGDGYCGVGGVFLVYISGITHLIKLDSR